jgi:hypothetical protein
MNLSDLLRLGVTEASGVPIVLRFHIMAARAIVYFIGLSSCLTVRSALVLGLERNGTTHPSAHNLRPCIEHSARPAYAPTRRSGLPKTN